MIRKSVEQWLNSLFDLRVVEDITDTKNEKSIGYSLDNTLIKVTVKQEKSVVFEFNFDILFRCPRAFEGIGFITLSLYTKKKRTAGMSLIGLNGLEVVNNINNTEMIISKEVHAFLELEYNQVREVIKYIKFEDELPCQKSY